MCRHIDVQGGLMKTVTCDRAPGTKTFRRNLQRARQSTDTGQPFLQLFRETAKFKSHFTTRLYNTINFI